MAGNKCQFYECGQTARTDKSLRFYKFPVKDPERWILHSCKLLATVCNLTDFAEKLTTELRKMKQPIDEPAVTPKNSESEAAAGSKDHQLEETKGVINGLQPQFGSDGEAAKQLDPDEV